jgi:hypothetical protein
VDEAKINNDIFFKNFLTGAKEEGNGNYQPLPLATSVISGVRENFISQRFSLHSAYPNPTTDRVTISYHINAQLHVNLELLTSGGARVRLLVDAQQDAGEHSITTDVSDLSPGVYLYRLQSGPLNETRKFIVTR